MSDVEMHLNFDAVQRAIRAAAADGLGVSLEAIADQSDRHVPIESGQLLRSRRVVVDRQGLEGAVTYDTEYAAVVHESMTEHHDAGRTAKFLENAGNAKRAATVETVASKIRSRLGT